MNPGGPFGEDEGGPGSGPQGEKSSRQQDVHAAIEQENGFKRKLDEIDHEIEKLRAAGEDQHGEKFQGMIAKSNRYLRYWRDAVKERKSLQKESSHESGDNQYVAQRYDKSHPEGFESPEYAGLKKMPEAHRQPGAKPWPVRQKQMHRQMGKAIDKGVLESERFGEEDNGPNPITLDYRPPERHDGWRGQVYSPPVTRLREGTNPNGVVIKEF